MEISQFSDYALRVLIFTALEPGRSTVPQISQAYGISQNHLVKVVHQLAKDGFLTTFRGRGGGFTLAREPETFTVGEVLRTTENFALVECLPPRSGSCCLVKCCVLKGALLKARTAFLAVLDDYTIADLLLPQHTLREALALS